MRTKESEEMYLETILVIKTTKGKVRSLDIAEHLNYSKPSVSRAVHLLKSKKYITIDSDGMIEFTTTGEKKADRIYQRHQVLTKLLISLGASEELAEENACRIEHVISDDLFLIIKEKFNK